MLIDFWNHCMIVWYLFKIQNPISPKPSTWACIGPCTPASPSACASNWLPALLCVSDPYTWHHRWVLSRLDYRQVLCTFPRTWLALIPTIAWLCLTSTCSCSIHCPFLQVWTHVNSFPIHSISILSLYHCFFRLLMNRGRISHRPWP